jgi:hypothetical protein
MMNNYYPLFLVLFGFLNILLTLIGLSKLRRSAPRPKLVVVKSRLGGKN